MPENKEKAFVVCADRRGRIYRGASATGDAHSVDVQIKCSSKNQVPVAVVHTHPSGIPLPSVKDMETSRAHGNIAICVRTDKHGVSYRH